MGKNRFSLQPLLNIKQLLEKEEKNNLAGLSGRLAAEIDTLGGLNDDLGSNADEYNGKAVSGVQISDLSMYFSWMGYLHSRIDECRDVIKTIESYKEECIARLIALMSDRKALECLKDKEYEEFIRILKVEMDTMLNDYISCQINRKGVISKGDANNTNSVKG